MLDSIQIALAVAVLLFVGYLLLKAYKPEWFGEKQWKPISVKQPFKPAPVEPFVAAQPPAAAAPPKKAAPLAGASGPGVAPPVKETVPEEAPRTISPGGPGAPNARPPADRPATLSPDAKPMDPYDSTNMETPVKDSMRYPEMSFGPGITNKGAEMGSSSGIASKAVSGAVSTFSPEFAQNGGAFMGDVFANDLTPSDADFAPA